MNGFVKNKVVEREKEKKRRKRERGLSVWLNGQREQ